MAITKYRFMRNLLALVILLVLVSSCINERKLTFEDVIAKHQEYSDKIERVQYDAHKIDTFAQNRTV
jgi:outer membrane lipoprotein-sorting protein